MPRHLSLWSRTSIVILCLLLLPLGQAVAQDELPQVLPFESISGDGAVGLWGDFFYRLSFDADIRLARESDGIHPGDDVHIVTSLVYPAAAVQPNVLGVATNQLVVRLSVAGQCFERRGRALLFRAPNDGAIKDCAEVGIQILDAQGNAVFDGDFDHILRTVTVELLRVGRQGRWKLRSVASFADPGFPFPVAGFSSAQSAAPPPGVTLIVGDDGRLSPFTTVAFRTLAP